MERRNQQAHCDALVAQLSQISGLPIIEDCFNDIWTVVVWDGSLGDTGGVAIYQNVTILNVELGWDEMCRPTFAGPGYTGWIDVYDGRVHIGLEFADPTQIPGAWGSETNGESLTLRTRATESSRSKQSPGRSAHAMEQGRRVDATCKQVAQTLTHAH